MLLVAVNKFQPKIMFSLPFSLGSPKRRREKATANRNVCEAAVLWFSSFAVSVPFKKKAEKLRLGRETDERRLELSELLALTRTVKAPYLPSTKAKARLPGKLRRLFYVNGLHKLGFGCYDGEKRALRFLQNRRHYKNIKCCGKKTIKLQTLFPGSQCSLSGSKLAHCRCLAVPMKR
jgi:hypothetical protein